VRLRRRQRSRQPSTTSGWRTAELSDTGRHLQPKSEVETLPFHFEGTVRPVTGVLKLALPCAGLCHDGGFDWIGLRTDTDQVVEPIVGTTLVVRPHDHAVAACLVGRDSPDAPVPIPLDVDLDVALDRDDLREMIDHSYELVVAGRTKKARAALDFDRIGRRDAS
jgi:hypothetical protein